MVLSVRISKVYYHFSLWISCMHGNCSMKCHNKIESVFYMRVAAIGRVVCSLVMSCAIEHAAWLGFVTDLPVYLACC